MAVDAELAIVPAAHVIMHEHPMRRCNPLRNVRGIQRDARSRPDNRGPFRAVWRWPATRFTTLRGATLNRDLAALRSFLTWLRDVEGVPVERPKLPRERESRGRERWLSADELRAFERACPPPWWPFFATLFYTGARLGEVQGLRGGDVLLHAHRILVHEEVRRVKSREAVRDLPIPSPLKEALGPHLARVAPGPADLVYPAAQDYGRLRRCGTARARPRGSSARRRTMHGTPSPSTRRRRACRSCGSRSFWDTRRRS